MQDSVDWFAMASIGAIVLFLLSYQLGVGQIPFFIGSGEINNRGIQTVYRSFIHLCKYTKPLLLFKDVSQLPAQS